jgi:hypothetical protein
MFFPFKMRLREPQFWGGFTFKIARDATLQAIAERPQRRGDSVDRPLQLDRCPIYKLNLSTCLGYRYVWGITHTIEQTEKGLFKSRIQVASLGHPLFSDKPTYDEIMSFGIQSWMSEVLPSFSNNATVRGRQCQDRLNPLDNLCVRLDTVVLNWF